MKTSSRSRNSGVSKDVGKELRIETAFQSSHLKDVTPDVHYVETHHVLNLVVLWRSCKRGSDKKKNIYVC